MNGNGKVQDVFLKKSKQKRQFPIEGNWRSKIHYDNTENTAMIMPVEVHNVSGQNSGFFLDKTGLVVLC